MTKKRWDKLVQTLWLDHGSADKHGYTDLMRESGFEAACGELRDKLQAEAAKQK
jgi:hypothetical protein